MITFLFFPPIIFISLQHCSGFCHTLTWISHGFTCIPHPEPAPASLSTRSLGVIPVHHLWALVSCIQPGLVVCFTLDNVHISMLFSQIIPPSPSPIESKSLFYASVSLSPDDNFLKGQHWTHCSWWATCHNVRGLRGGTEQGLWPFLSWFTI